MRETPQLHLVETFEELERFFTWLGQSRHWLALDTETTGLDYGRDYVRLVQFGDANEGWALPMDWWYGAIRDVFRKYRGDYLLHNAKFDIVQLSQHDIQVPWDRVHDSMMMAHIANTAKPMGLKVQAANRLGPQWAFGQRDLDLAMKLNGWDWETIPYECPPYWEYAALDCVLTYRIAEQLWEEVKPFREAYELEMAAHPIMAKMEMRGVKIDIEYIEEKYPAWLSAIHRLERHAAMEFGVDHLGSDAQVIKRLVQDGVRLVKRTQSGQLQLTKDVLDGVEHPLAQMKRDHRMFVFYLSHLENYREMADPDWLLHCNIHPVGAEKTGRMSITRPAMQTLPRKADIRDCFIPRLGHALVSCDYDQVEMRLAAHFSRDERLMAMFADPNVDIFTNMCREMMGDPTIQKSDPRRQTTKNAGYAKLYGAGAATFGRTAGIPTNEAEAFLHQFDETFPGMRMMQLEDDRKVKETVDQDKVGYVETPTGKRLRVPLDRAYKATNYKIQAHAAEVLKRAVVEVDNAGLGDYLVLPIHDELVADVPVLEAEEAAVEMARAMSDTKRYIVPLTASAEVLYSHWGDKYRKGD